MANDRVFIRCTYCGGEGKVKRFTVHGLKKKEPKASPADEAGGIQKSVC